MASKASSSLLAASNRASNNVSRYLRQHPRMRNLAGACTETVSSTSTSIPQPPNKKYRIQTAILLNRSPTLTRTPIPFEAAYQEYNARIARALFNPFPTAFYFKAGSILETQFMHEESQREKAAFGWKRHILPEDLDTKDGKTRNVTGNVLVREETEEIMPRITEADRKGDIRSLDRKGHRNLYLLIKKGKGRDEWRLPGGIREIQQGELLHEAAQRELHAECGTNMDTWIVGRHPIGVMDDALPVDLTLTTTNFEGAKTFFFKAHILAGQVTPSAGSLADFAWLTKSEIKRAVTPEYWTNLQNILSDF